MWLGKRDNQETRQAVASRPSRSSPRCSALLSRTTASDSASAPRSFSTLLLLASLGLWACLQTGLTVALTRPSTPQLITPSPSKLSSSQGEPLRIALPANGWRPRAYQQPLWDYLEGGGTHAVAVWHRRAGKDEIALNHAACSAHERVGNYWHMLPEYNQARKAIWDAINPHSGKRRIDEAFPLELRKSTNNVEMKIEFKVGSIWQVVGSDNFNSLIGSPPVGITYSEWSVANPMAHAYLSPILAENNGWALFIYTARGYNHGFSTYQGARNDPQAFAQLLTVDETGAISPEMLERQRRTYHDLYGPEAGDAFYRQEFYNDWSASNIGAVIGPAIERADKQGRILDYEADGESVEISSDIGFRDTAAWWFWIRRHGGYDVVDYDQGVGMDADDWVERLQQKPYKIARIWLPHDAKVKTFQSKHSSVERFINGFGAERVRVVPQTKIADRVNAARLVAEKCRFHKTHCKDGLNGLRSWSYDYDAEKRIYSKEPLHDWASHPGDAYSYGAQVMRDIEVPETKPKGKTIHDITLDELYEHHERDMAIERRI